MTSVRALAFGDLQSETWGLVWMQEPGPGAHLALRRQAAAAVLDVTLDAGGQDEPWHLEGDGVSLALEPTGLAAQGGTEELQSVDQLCDISGQMPSNGGEDELRCFGWRSSVDGELGSIDSFRLLASWLDTSQGFSLIAFRPRKARGHDEDVIAATLIEDPPQRVSDPRLSTTYTAAGLPARAGLELWLAEEDDPEAEPDATAHYPRRAAGESVGEGLDWEEGAFELHGSLLRWHSHGKEGPGVYLLGQRR